MPDTIEEAISNLIDFFVDKGMIVDVYNRRLADLNDYCEHLFAHLAMTWGFYDKSGPMYWFFRSQGIHEVRTMVSIVVTAAWKRMHNLHFDVGEAAMKHAKCEMNKELELE